MLNALPPRSLIVDTTCTCRAVGAIQFRAVLLTGVGNTPIGHNYRGPTGGKHFGRRRYDAVVRASDQSNMTLQSRTHYFAKG